MKTHSTPKTIFKLHSNHMHRCNDCSVCRPKTEHVVLCVVVLLLLSHGFYLVGEEMFCGCDKRTGIMALVRCAWTRFSINDYDLHAISVTDN